MSESREIKRGIDQAAYISRSKLPPPTAAAPRLLKPATTFDEAAR